MIRLIQVWVLPREYEDRRREQGIEEAREGSCGGGAESRGWARSKVKTKGADGWGQSSSVGGLERLQGAEMLLS